MAENRTQMSGGQAAVAALQAALDCARPAVIDIAVDPAALYSFRRDSFKHRGG
jgi:acetolactate synthase-1/2/3 large subunit/sulfoacetaldehyde acetyltransferase